MLTGQTFTSIPSNGYHDGINAAGLQPEPASYDNIVYPNGDSPVVCDPIFYPYHGGQLDIYGLMFTVNLNAGGTGLVNVWSNFLNDPANLIGLDYGVSDGTLGSSNGNPLFTVENYVGNTNSYPAYSPSGVVFSTVPEPSALLLVGAGIATLPILRMRQRKRV